MKFRFLIRIYVVIFVLASMVGMSAADRLIHRQWQAGGVAREALIHVPPDAKTRPTPVVFVFHGHGGTMRKAAMMFRIGQLWPEALVVYPQGLPTPGKIIDPAGKKSGWQSGAGDQGDRDLKFIDAILETLQKDYQVNTTRIYATGHSNGAAFTYVLWAMRREHFAAFAPSAGLLPALLGENPRAGSPIDQRKLPAFKGTPKPIFHIAGSNDPIVRYEWQKSMIEGLRIANQCLPGKPWLKDKRCTIFESKTGAPVVTHIHNAKHSLPEYVPSMIIGFFKSNPGR